MSGHVRDRNGVLLDYHRVTDYRIGQRPLRPEAERILRAETTFDGATAALNTLEMVLACLAADVCDLAWARIVDALDVVHEALQIQRAGVMSADERVIERAA